MIKVDIVKNSIITNSAVFESQELADSWIAQETANNSFGKSERWVKDGDPVDLTQEEKDSALDSRQALDGLRMEYLLGAEYTIEQTDIGNAPKLEKLRAIRNVKLSECDWTQLPDCPLSNEEKAAWASYRQALRDLPEQQGLNLDNPTWPEQP